MLFEAHSQPAHDDGIVEENKSFEAQSAFASTLLADVEKAHPSQIANHGSQHTNLLGSTIDTSARRGGIGPVHAAKSQLLNDALLDIGMGAYQWILFLTTSTGFFLDYFWMVSFIVIAPSASNEAQFFYSSNKEAYLSISQYAGLALGALAWPILSDAIGRKWMFTSTLVLMGMGGLIGAGMPAFSGLCVVGFIVGLAIAGNQALNAMVLVESLPASHQYLVAMQGSLSFIAEYTCGTGPDAVSTTSSFQHSKRAAGVSASGASSCHYVSNKGWRYVWRTFGCITLFIYLCRFAFSPRETPKYLLSKGRDAEVAQTVKDIATYNKRQTWLTETSFARIDSTLDVTGDKINKPSASRALVASVTPLGLVLLMLIWAVTGLTFPLHKTYLSDYLVTKGVSAVTATNTPTDFLYSRYLYIALCAIPGPLVAGLLIEAKGLGRKRVGAIIAVLNGLFMFLSTLARSRSAWLAFECILSFLQFAGLAVVTTYTVEVLAGPVRGAGVGVTGFSWGFFGMIAIIITSLDSDVGGGAVWFCGAVWIFIACAWLALPLETRVGATS